MKKNVYMHVCINESLCCIVEIDTVLRTNYTSFRYFLKDNLRIPAEFC